MKQIHACTAVMLATLILLSSCHHPTPSAAAVEIAPGTGTQSDEQVLKELVAAFDQAEMAVRQANLEALMLFYGKDYNYHGLKRPDVRRVWDEVFSHYAHIRSAHVFSNLKIVQDGSRKQAFVTCTGGLYGTDKVSGTPVTIDNWVGEVHSLVKENDSWKFRGNVPGDPTLPPASAPHHPLF